MLNSTGAVCYVSFGGRAQAIPSVQIDNVKAFLLQREYEITVSHERIQKGVSVEVLFGAFKGVVGEVVNILGQSRILVRIDSMNCSLYANISKEEVLILKEKSQEKVIAKRRIG